MIFSEGDSRRLIIAVDTCLFSSKHTLLLLTLYHGPILLSSLVSKCYSRKVNQTPIYGNKHESLTILINTVHSVITSIYFSDENVF